MGFGSSKERKKALEQRSDMHFRKITLAAMRTD